MDLEALYENGRAGVLTTIAGRRPGDARLGLPEARRIAARATCSCWSRWRAGRSRGRYSMIGLDPDVIFRSNGAQAEINAPKSQRDADAFERARQAKPLRRALRELIGESRIEMPAGPAADGSAGVFGYLGYDMVRQMERLAPAKPDPIGVPEALMIRPTVMVVFDSVRDEMVDRHAGAADAPDVDARKAALTRLRRSAHRGGGGGARWSARPCAAAWSIRLLRVAGRPSPTPREPDIFSAWWKARERLHRAGDAFQIVLSQRFTSRFDLPAFALYRALRRVNPSPYSVLSRFRRLPDRGVEPGDPGAGARGQGDDPADRGHALARRDARRGR